MNTHNPLTRTELDVIEQGMIDWGEDVFEMETLTVQRIISMARASLEPKPVASREEFEEWFYSWRSAGHSTPSPALIYDYLYSSTVIDLPSNEEIEIWADKKAKGHVQNHPDLGVTLIGDLVKCALIEGANEIRSRIKAVSVEGVREAYNFASKAASDLRGELLAERTLVDKLAETLKFYGDKKNWAWWNDPEAKQAPVIIDSGNSAREALAALSKLRGETV